MRSLEHFQLMSEKEYNEWQVLAISVLSLDLLLEKLP
jgi:hypothetical protein